MSSLLVLLKWQTHISKTVSVYKISKGLDSQLPPNAREEKVQIARVWKRSHQFFPPVLYQCGSQKFICYDLNSENRFPNPHKRSSAPAKAGRDISKTSPTLCVSVQEGQKQIFSLTSLEWIPTGFGQMLFSSARSCNDMAVSHITATQK